MSAETPAAVLKGAADEIRQLATEATPGPWHAWAGTYPHLVIQGPPGVLSEAKGIVSTNLAVNERADSSWIAALHPGVGMALADWLESTAATVEAVTRKHADAAPTDAHWLAPALAVAQQILGAQR